MKNLKDGLSFSQAGERLGFQDGDLLVSLDGLDVVEFDNMMLVSGILFEDKKNIVVNRGGKLIDFVIKSHT